MGRWLSSASLVACGQQKFGKPTDTKRLAVVARGLHSLCWKVAYEKGIIGFDVRVDDAGSDERFGRYPRVRGWGRLLGTLLGSGLLWLRLSRCRSSQAGHQGEERRGIHRWRLRG